MVLGGKLTTEYQRLGTRLLQLVQELGRRGAVRAVPFALVEKETRAVAARCVSNDAHIIGLARASGVRLLCTEDRVLGDDFRNKDLISNPRGNVCNRASHAKLITKHCNCNKPSRKKK